MLDGAEYFYKVGHMLSDRLVDRYAADMAEQARKMGPVDPELRVNNPDMTAFYEAKKAERDAYVAQVKEMLQEGRGISGIAKNIGRSQNYVRRIMKENDLFGLRKVPDTRNAERKEQAALERKKAESVIWPLRMAGHSYREIEKMTGYSSFMVYRVIKERNG